VKRRTALAALSTAALLAGLPAAVRAAEAFEVLRAAMEPSLDGESWLLSADFSITLTPMLEDAVNRGITLVFVVEFELLRPRWWWWDESAAEVSRTYRLTYHVLTRQYRVQVEGNTTAHTSLRDALETISRLRNWRVMPRDRVRPGRGYEGWIRLRLDASHLPKPLQLSAITDKDWSLQSLRKRFTLTPQIPPNGR
jgi:hypothetical protein